MLQLEVAAFFALLEFITSKVTEEPVKAIQVFSSVPAFVFSFTPEGSLFKKGSPYRTLLDAFSSNISIAVSYIIPQKNAAFYPVGELPSLPINKNIKLNYNNDDFYKTEFKPFQKGIKL